MKLLGFVLFLVPLMAWSNWLPDDVAGRERSELFKIIGIKSNNASMTEAQYTAMIEKVTKIYAPVVQGLGGNLNIMPSWNNDKLIAQAHQKFGSWNIELSGGMARIPTMTLDGLTLILCHELGHHVAGFSFATAALPFLPAWASNEGQSDYFATHVCARKIWENERDVNAKFRESVTSAEQSNCSQVYSGSSEKDLCYRSLAASKSLGDTLAFLSNKNKPSLITPDTTQVNKTNSRHPNPQCRLDTYLQGALCTATFNDRLIPGKKYSKASLKAEQEAASFSCTKTGGFSIGIRPACWFKARL